MKYTTRENLTVALGILFSPLISLAVLSGALVSCEAVKLWQISYPDNVIEESVERDIRSVTGLDMGLTPLTGNERD